MTITPQTSFVGPPFTGQADAFIQWAIDNGAKNPDDVKLLVQTIFDLAPKKNLKPQVICGQVLVECSLTNGTPFANTWWSAKPGLNAFSLGITGDAQQNAAAPKFANGHDAAVAGIAHVYLYTIGDPDDDPDLKGKDPRRAAFLKAGYQPGAYSIIDAFSNRYAIDSSYGQQIAARTNAVAALNLPFTGDTPVPNPTPPPTKPMGHVPMPPMIVKDVTGAIGVNREEDHVRWGRINATVVHTSDGTFLGNEDCFVNQQFTWGGLTDYQVGGPGDGQYDGVIMRFINPQAEITPYANGTYGAGPNPPSAAGKAYHDKYCKNDPALLNALPRSIEHPDAAGMATYITDRQFESSCLLQAYIHAEEAGQTAETFANVFGHSDFGVPHTGCPGTRWWNRWTEMVNRIKEIMAAYQEGKPLSKPILVTYPPNWTGGDYPQPTEVAPPPKVYAKPAPIPGPIEDQDFHGTPLVALPHTWKVFTDKAECRVAGTAWADETREPLPKGTEVNTAYLYRSKTPPYEYYVIGTGGSRVLLDDLEPVVEAKPAPKPDPEPTPTTTTTPPPKPAPATNGKAKTAAKKGS